MAFALALQSVHDLPDGHGKIILTATTAIIVITVSSFSGIWHSTKEFAFDAYQTILSLDIDSEGFVVF